LQVGLARLLTSSHREDRRRTIPGAKPVDPERIVEQGVRPLAGGIDAWAAATEPA